MTKIKKTMIAVTAIVILLAISAAAFQFISNRGKKAQAASPTTSMGASATCDGFKVLQASGWFCIPKGGKPYRLTGPDKAMRGEKAIPRH